MRIIFITPASSEAHIKSMLQIRTRSFKHSDKAAQRGIALIMVIFFFVTVSLAVILSATVGALVELRTYRTIASSKFAYIAAEAGIEDMYYRIIKGKLVPASQTIVLNGATSTVTVVSTSATQNEVYATGDSANNEVRKIYLSLSKNTTSVIMPYGAQVGEGGIDMSNGTTIDGTGLANGDVYSDGQVKGFSSGGVTVTGNVITSSGLNNDQIASSTSCVTDEVVGNTNPNIDYAQSFMMSGTSSDELSSVTLYIKRNGNAVGANIRITADNAGKPATTALATEALSYSNVNTTYSWVTITFTVPATLNPSTLYWVVLDSTQSASKYWYWCRSNSDTYSTGSAAYKLDWSTAGAWTALPGDLTFKTTFGGGVSKIDGVYVKGTAKADTITSSKVDGDAYYKSISGTTVGGTSYPGSPTPPYIPLPISTSTIAQWKTDAAAGGTITGYCGAGGNAACNTFPLTLGPKVITGNLIIDNGKLLTVTGTLYVQGNVDINNNGTVVCDLGYGASSCLIIADGYINASNNTVFQGSGISGSYIMLLSTKTGCLGSGGTGCGTNSSAIELTNNITGALFYTTDSLIDISNNALVTAVVGYMIKMQNNSTIMYDPLLMGLSFAPAASGGTGGWNTYRWSEF